MKTHIFSTAKTPRFLLVFFLAFLASWGFDAVADEKLPAQTESKIRAILNSPRLKEAHVGLSILDLGTAKDASTFPAKAPVGKPFRVLFERDAQKKFMPASNMKIFTAAIALQLLGKEKTFPTRVLQQEKLLVLRGGGDPSLKVSDLEKLAEQIKARGVREVHGIMGDGSAFTAETGDGKFPFGWTVDDTRWYYGPEISALAIERNHFDLLITGGAKTGIPAQAMLSSPLPLGIAAKIETGSPELSTKSAEELIDFSWETDYKTRQIPEDTNHIPPSFGSHFFAAFGRVAPQQKISQGIAFPDPPRVAASALAGALKKQDVRVLPAINYFRPLSLSQDSVIAQHNSPPLGVLLQRLLKNSDNLYAEMLLRDAAYYHDGTGDRKAGPRAHALLKKWMIAQNIDVSTLRFEDGSGLSRYNLLTPRATAELLVAINRMKDGEAIWNALPIAGVDGTLRNRMRSTPAARNVRAKTGTLSLASNLSGYVTTRDNRRLAVALYVNFARNTATARWAQDEIFAALAASDS